MPLVNWKISVILTWSKNWVVSSATEETEFAITDTKLYVPVVPLATLDNTKLMQQTEIRI